MIRGGSSRVRTPNVIFCLLAAGSRFWKRWNASELGIYYYLKMSAVRWLRIFLAGNYSFQSVRFRP